MSPLLTLSDVWKTYPGVVAVAGVDFGCSAGEIHALVGENGAGKSTLMSVASGSVLADRGRVAICGQVVRAPDPARMRDIGLSIVYQDNSLVPDLNVAQNLALSTSAAVRPPTGELYPWAAAELARFETPIDVHSPIRDLAVAERQIVEIVRAVVAGTSVLVLDEPTATLGSGEVARLHDLLRAAASDGTGVVYITHRLPEVFAVADRVSVMRDGRMVEASISASDIDEDELVSLMIGRPFHTAFPEKASERGALPLLQVSDIGSTGLVRDVSFDGYAGEILGLAGVEGNGQLELLRLLAGLSPRTGCVTTDGATVAEGSVTAARAGGIVYISSDRSSEALFLGLGVRENMMAGSLSEVAQAGLVLKSREEAKVQSHVRILELQVTSLDQTVSLLSGGNQQKVSLGRAFVSEPQVFLIDQPTQGVDAGTRLEIYRLLRTAADKGALVLINSSDAVELAGLCDRVLVMVRGQVMDELSGSEITVEGIVGAAVRSDTDIDRHERSPSQRRNAIHRARTNDFAPIAVLLLGIATIALAVGQVEPRFYSSRNVGNLLFLAVPLGFAALGQAAVMLVGGIDLSIGPVIGLTTVAVAQTMQPDGGAANLGFAIGAGLAIGVGVGFVNAVLIRRLRMSPLIATLATFILVQGLGLLWLDRPGGFVAREFTDAAKYRVGMIPWAFLLLLTVAICGETLYRRTTIGLWVRAVGSRPVAARRLGVPSERIYYGAYMTAGLLGAVGGIFFAATIGAGDAPSGVGFTLASFAAVALGGLSTWGGRGSALGPLVGAVFLALTTNVFGLLNVPSTTLNFVLGGIMILAIALYSRLRATGLSIDEIMVKY